VQICARHPTGSPLRTVAKNKTRLGAGRAAAAPLLAVAEALDYLVTLVRLRILDALAGPEPETPADLQRKRDRERIKRAFPEIEP
jgi:hypothetical protein